MIVTIFLRLVYVISVSLSLFIYQLQQFIPTLSLIIHVVDLLRFLIEVNQACKRTEFEIYVRPRL